MVGLVGLLVLGAQQALPVTPLEPLKPAVYQVTGSVVDEAGVPVPEADCVILSKAGGWTDSSSGPDGRFAATSKSAGPFTVWAKSEKGWSRTPAKTDGIQEAKVVINVSELRTVEGKVVDEVGNPVPEARVELTSLFIPQVNFRDITRTDPQGHYRFTGVFAESKLKIQVSARGMSQESVVKSFTADEAPAQVVLQTANRTVHGRVVGFDMKPIQGAIVRCVNGGRGRPVETDRDGRFEITGLVKGPVSIAAWSGNMLGNAFVPDSKQEVVIKLGDQGPLQALLATMPPQVTPGVQAPELNTSLDFINSPLLTLEGLKGKVVLLDFWGMWCPPCVEEVPEIVALHHDFPEVTLISIHTLLGTQEKLARFALSKGMTWPVVMDGDKIGESVATSYAYGIRGYPTLVLIDGTGKVAWVGHGAGGAREAITLLGHSGGS